jgi:hypothetical protein
MHSVEIDGEVLHGSGTPIGDLWFARYSGHGELLQRRIYLGTEGGSAGLSQLGNDWFGNVLLVGDCRLFVGPGQAGRYCLVKQRPSGKVLWWHAIQGEVAAMAADRSGHIWLAGWTQRTLSYQDQVFPANETRSGFVFRIKP